MNLQELQKELADLDESGNREELQKRLDDLDVKQVTSYVKQCILQGKSDPVPFLKCILKGSLNQSELCESRSTQIYTTLINLLQKNEINAKVAFSIIGVLLAEVDNLQVQCLVNLAQYFVEMVKSGTFTGGKALDLFPKILSIIDQCEDVPKGDGSVKGQEFKGMIVNSLCSCKWNPSMTLLMATLFHDIPLTLEQLRFVLEKVVRMFKDIELSDQPAIVFQLLRLSSKGHKKLIVEGITCHFTSQDDANRGRSIMIDSEDLMLDSVCLTTLRQVEGTVILHILQAVKQDQDLGREIVKYFKVLQNSDAHKVVSPFNLSLLLSVSRLHHFEDQIMDFVKGAVVKCLREEARQKQSFWVRECFPGGVPVRELLLETVDNSSYDWDHVIQGLLQLGFGLMDSYGPKLVFGQLTETPPLDESHMTPNQLACKLGRSLLLKIFKFHEVIRSEILDQTFQNIITKSTTPVTHYLDFLSDIVYSAPQLLLESTSKVQEVVSEISQLPPMTGQGLLMAIQPLLKLSPLLKDSLLLVLRKAMFSRQLNSRKIGALGFLMVLKNFRVVGSLPSSQVSQPFALSQIRVEVHGRYNAASNEALCLEILGNLRRCFTQQADIRLAIYQDLYDVLHRNSELKTPVLDMLLSQIKKYYDQNDEDCPPLRFDPCILEQGGQVFLSEPLSHLIGCVQHCVRKAAAIAASACSRHDDDDEEEEAGESQQSFQQLQAILTDLTKRMIDTSMEAFELDKSADFNLGTNVGVKNNIFAILLMGIYEVLMEYTFEKDNLSEDSCKQVTELFSNYSKITSLLKDKSSGPSGKKGKPPSTKAPTSLLSVHTVVSLLRHFIENDSADSRSADVLLECKDLFPHLVTVACQKLEQVHAKGYADTEQRNKDKVLKDCWVLGRLFYLHYGANHVGDNNLGERDKNLISQCLFGLSQVIKIAILKGNQAVYWCLSHLEKEVDEEKDLVSNTHIVEKAHQHIKKMQRLASTIINEDQQNQNWKDFATLLTVIGQLSTFLPSSSEEFQQSFNWLLKVCTDCNIEDASSSKLLLSLLLTHAKETKLLSQTLRNLCQDIHSQIGDIEKDCVVEDRTHFAVTKSNCCTPSSTLMLVLNHMDTDLDDVEWVIKKHQAQLLAAASKSDDDDSMGATQQEQMDRSLCTHLGILVNGYIELCHSAITSKLCSQSLLKSLTKLFNTLAVLTKHYLSLYANKAGSVCSRFEKLVNLVGRQLTQPTYCMITYVQMLEMEDLSHVPDKDKKGKKKGGGGQIVAQSGMAKAIKQMKSISNLVFSIEQLEKFLIQLSKKSKVNLMENFKLSTSRDFRINAEKVNEVVEDSISSDDENGSESGDGDDEGDENQDDVPETVSDSEDENQRPADAEENQVTECREKPTEPPVKRAKLSSKKTKK